MNITEMQIGNIDMSIYKTKVTGKMKKYSIQCPCCGRRSASKKPLNDHGMLTLHENEFIYQRCIMCQDKPTTEHEKLTMIL